MALDQFLNLSMMLCGISTFDLTGTGYADSYYQTVETIVGADRLARLLAVAGKIPVGPAGGEFLRQEILGNEEFGPIARNIIKLWLMATWFELPQEWREKFGLNPDDRTHIPYTYAYVESLLGPATGCHPAGAKPSGHQAWTLAPQHLPIPSQCP